MSTAATVGPSVIYFSCQAADRALIALTHLSRSCASCAASVRRSGGAQTSKGNDCGPSVDESSGVTEVISERETAWER